MSCEKTFKELLGKIEGVVKQKWPLAFNTEGWMKFAEENHPDLKKKHDTLYEEANQLWLNGRDEEFKKIVTDWGKTVLEMYRLFDVHLKGQHREAA